jgi:hypothetical protein
VKSDKAAFAEIFTGVLDGAPPKPVRPQLLHYYSSKFYAEHIKARFDGRMTSLTSRALRTNAPPPKALSVRPAVTKEVWEEQPAGFQREVQDALERDYQTALRGWKASLADSPTRTPEEMAV